MSQSDLARTLGITFQQVQKYERGSNRVSVGKLYRLADILDVPLTFFFDGLEGAGSARGDGADAEDGQSPLLSRRELDLLRAWRTAPPEISDAVASLLRSLIPGMAEEEPGADVPGAATPSGFSSEAAPAPKRRGRPPKAKAADAAPAVPAKGGRRRNAVWDPSDIVRAAREAKG